jgi:transcriptional regulator with XRE-family HTH domain
LPLYNENQVPFISEYDYRLIKEVRQLRNLSLAEFSVYMKTDFSTLSKLEKGLIYFSIHYQSKFKEALQELKISNLEMLSVRRLVDLKKQREMER